MTHSVLATILIVALVVSALAGPWVLRSAAPLLMRMPRQAVGLLAGGVSAWAATLLAVGPVLAWVFSGPTVLPSAASQVCEQCLSAANPFGGRTAEAGIPTFLLLVLPAVLAGLWLVSIAGQSRRRYLGTTAAARRFRERGSRRIVHGYAVLLVEDRHPFALSLPRRCGGIVVSTAAVDLLDAVELRAVLAHEYAHLRQRHHVISGMVGSLTVGLRWVPLVGAAADALEHYVEISADDYARRVAGTPALASALLLLGQAGRPTGDRHEAVGALHALGPDRIGHLVHPERGVAGLAATAAGVGFLAALSVLAGAVHVPYVMAVLTGCV